MAWHPYPYPYPPEAVFSKMIVLSFVCCIPLPRPRRRGVTATSSHTSVRIKNGNKYLSPDPGLLKKILSNFALCFLSSFLEIFKSFFYFDPEGRLDKSETCSTFPSFFCTFAGTKNLDVEKYGKRILLARYSHDETYCS